MAKRILIVDDEVAFTRLLKLNLEDAGEFEVEIQNGGRWALEAARQFRPHLIILDVVMPDVSGTEVAEQLCADDELSHIPVLFLTATVSREDVVSHGAKIGGYPSLAKPVSVEEVTAAIGRCLETTCSA